MKEPQRGANGAWAYRWGSDLGATLGFEVFRAAICVQSDSQGGAGVCFFFCLCLLRFWAIQNKSELERQRKSAGLSDGTQNTAKIESAAP